MSACGPPWLITSSPIPDCEMLMLLASICSCFTSVQKAVLEESLSLDAVCFVLIFETRFLYVSLKVVLELTL